MRYVVAYDIGDDRIRLAVAKVLSGYGDRVQASVFECSLEQNELDELAGRLESLLDDCEDGEVRLYRLCSACLAKSFGIGRTVDTPATRGFVIV